jgi:hypothetical protein
MAFPFMTLCLFQTRPNSQLKVKHFTLLPHNLPGKLKEYVVCNQNMNSVLNIININEITSLIETRQRRISATTDYFYTRCEKKNRKCWDCVALRWKDTDEKVLLRKARMIASLK